MEAQQKARRACFLIFILSEDFVTDPMDIPNCIIIYQLKLDGLPMVSVQIDTKKKLKIERKIRD